MSAITLATCAAWPALGASDECLAAALRARGHTVHAAPWNGDFAPFARAAAVVIRATWDYHDAPGAYLAWLDRLDPRRTFNLPSLVRWNLAKTHVLDLAERGAPIPRTRAVAATPEAIATALDDLALDDAVIKPLVGASGFGVERVARGREAEALRRATARKATDRVLVQEFLPAIAEGELAGVFFDGAFSHGLRRVPAAGEFRINSQYGGRMQAAALPPDVIARMTEVLALLPERPLYARIDGVVQEGRFVLIEVEVNEPGLGLDHAPGAGERFADALLARLSRDPSGP
jgi:glutathione synthase/RimK-type ligase-like ATP-grasp enzyme